MNSKTRRSIGPIFLASMTAALLALSACTINIGTTQAPSREDSSSAEAVFSAGDIMFAQMMIPHHEQALEMSLIALERSTVEEVRDLAQRIYDGQGPEIEQMKSWIESARGFTGMFHEMPDGSLMPNNMSGNNMMNGHSMAGMASESELTRLESSDSPEFDILFLQLMIEHHEGALAMVQMIENSSNAEAKALAEQITRVQNLEIEEMTRLLESLSDA